MTARGLLGCIADDFTGATDLANNLVREGMRVVQTIGVPAQRESRQASATDADAIVCALKSRNLPAAEAVSQALEAARWLQHQGARQFYFKYCSTFDSTDQGNIGPVTEALMDFLGTDFTIATPAFPDNHRTLFKGHLFVGDVLLSESGMQNHPLTPMTDSNLVRVLQAQCRRRVSLVDYRVVAQGPAVIRSRMDQLRQEGVSVALVDALSNDDLRSLATAVRDFPLLTAGSGLAIGLPANIGRQPSLAAAMLPAPQGTRAVVCGSCSQASRRQVAAFLAADLPAFQLDPLRMAEGEDQVAQALQWAAQMQSGGPVLVYSSADPSTVEAVQQRLGVQAAGEMTEKALAQVACGLVSAGVGQLVVAGGETSGACVQALGLTQLRVGFQIDPGVPWCHASSPPRVGSNGQGLHICLKSGNFGTEDFFIKAFGLLK